MELDFDRPVLISKRDAIDIVGQFLIHEWKHLKESDIEIVRTQTGVNNEVYFVTRIAKDGIKEPNAVVIRKYADIMGRIAQDSGEAAEDGETANIRKMMWASEVEQIMIQLELARLGLGPKLYGVYDKGRVEELIDCRKITFDEARDFLLEADVAINMARIHAMNLPMRKPNYKHIDILRPFANEIRDKSLPYYEEFGTEMEKEVARYDFNSDLDFLEPWLTFKHNRMVLMNWDPHMDNVCVRNNPKENELKTIIFDFDIAGYNTRGKDLGLFLASRSGFFPICRDDRKLETKEQFLPFLRAYLKECESLFQDFDSSDRGLDSEDHVWIETLIGGAVSCLLFLFFMTTTSARVKGKGPVVESARRFMPVLFEGYKACLEQSKIAHDRILGRLNE